MQKTFKSSDVFYNNGMVNLYRYIIKSSSFPNINMQLTEDKLSISFEEKEESYLYESLLNDFIDKNDIVCHTQNDRLYWDAQINNFRLDKKFDVKGKASGNDVLHGVYSYITVEETGKTVEELSQVLDDFCRKSNLKEKEDLFVDKKTGKYKPPEKVKLVKYITKKKAVANFANYLAKGNDLTFDSKIHQFEDGGFCFRDMLSNKSNVIDKWDALIYWYGSRIRRFYNLPFYIYINSYNLKALDKFKAELEFKEEHEKITDKNGNVKTIPTNITVMKMQLKKDGINNQYFYISKSQQEFQLKFFMYLFSYIQDREEDYEHQDEYSRPDAKEIYESLKYISFVTYTEDGNLKSELTEYTKAYRLFGLFYKLGEADTEDLHLFRYLANIIEVISFSVSEKLVNLTIQKFCDNLLNFRTLRKDYYEASYGVLDSPGRGFGKGLKIFESQYLDYIKIGRGDLDMKLHEKSRTLGEEIGNFSANIEEKDLIFKLRNIKNHKQLVSYFTDVKFSILRKDEQARFTKEFDMILIELLDVLEQSSENWELIRDYIAIYAINKYKSVTFAKQQGGK